MQEKDSAPRAAYLQTEGRTRFRMAHGRRQRRRLHRRRRPETTRTYTNRKAKVHKKQQLITPSLRSDKGTSLGFAVGRGRTLFALTPSPSPTLWERGVGARGSAPCSAFPLSRLAGEGDIGGGGSVCVGACCFALTPSPSPTGWERGVGAHGGAPCSAFPLSREAGEGDKGGEGNTAHLLVHACAGKNSPCFKDFVPNRCTLTSCPLPPYQGRRGSG